MESKMGSSLITSTNINFQSRKKPGQVISAVGHISTVFLPYFNPPNIQYLVNGSMGL